MWKTSGEFFQPVTGPDSTGLHNLDIDAAQAELLTPTRIHDIQLHIRIFPTIGGSLVTAGVPVISNQAFKQIQFANVQGLAFNRGGDCTVRVRGVLGGAWRALCEGNTMVALENLL